MSILAFLTEASCGEACWHAKEPVCRCSCGGKNHGCLTNNGAASPVRTAKIDGYRYELKAVDEIDNLWRSADAVNASFGCKDIQTSGTMRWHYTWNERDKGAPARIKLATKDQRAKWRELQAFKDAPQSDFIALLWIRVDPPAEKWCPDECTRCNQLRIEAHQKKRKATFTPDQKGGKG